MHSPLQTTAHADHLIHIAPHLAHSLAKETCIAFRVFYQFVHSLVILVAFFQSLIVEKHV